MVRVKTLVLGTAERIVGLVGPENDWEDAIVLHGGDVLVSLHEMAIPLRRETVSLCLGERGYLMVYTHFLDEICP